ncbi:MAG: leucyl aminopeptidase [Candidatus Margulisiibacteriota bacterium]
MKIEILNKDITKVRCDLLSINIFEGALKAAGELGSVDKALKGIISSLISGKEISGKLSSSFLLHTHGKLSAKYVLIVGSGKRGDFNLEAVRMIAAETVKQAKKMKVSSVAVVVPSDGVSGAGPFETCRSFVEAALIQNYEFSGYKTGKEDEGNFSVDSLLIVEKNTAYSKTYKKAIELGSICGSAVNSARELVNMPSNMLTPKIFAVKAKNVCSKNSLRLKVLDAAQIKKIGMGAIWGVAKGSDHEPVVLVIEYNGSGKNSKFVALIGKGVTFDSGGISIKPSKKMEDMKEDMAGAAAVLFAMEAAAKLSVKKNILAVIPLVENMPSGGALKPGDVIKTLSGKTVEIISTDAEGRLVLADAITYAKKLGAEKIIDFATLTGACTTCLGDIAAAAVGNDKELTETVIASAEKSGERLWELPLYDEYRQYLKSTVADIKNCSDLGKASTSTGAMFLKEFVGDTPWVHVDIANIASLDRDIRFWGKGASGAGVLTAINYLLYS